MSVVCPFCRTAFAPADIPAARRTPCPNCGESVPLTTTAPPPPAAQPAADAARLANPPSGGLVFLSLGLTALIVAGFAVWWFVFNTPKPPPPTALAPPGPPATLPPAALSGLKYIPKDSQVVAAVQPSALWQYADRTGQSADALLADLGVPKTLLDQLRDAGLPPDRVHHLIAAAGVDDLKLVLVLVLREPLKDDARFRKALKVKGQKVELDGLPLSLVMAQPDDMTYLFSLNETDLGTAKAPHAGLSALPQGVRESVAKVSPAAFGWVATDAKDWAGVKLLQLPVIPAELSGKLAGVQAFAAGVSLEPDLQLKVAVRTNDSTLARTTAAGMKERLAELNPTVAAADEWAEATVPLHPPKETLPKLKAALKR